VLDGLRHILAAHRYIGRRIHAMPISLRPSLIADLQVADFPRFARILDIDPLP
jgi:hypothetical protein